MHERVDHFTPATSRHRLHTLHRAFNDMKIKTTTTERTTRNLFDRAQIAQFEARKYGQEQVNG